MKYLHHVWLKNVENYAEKTAIEDKTGSFTYSDLSSRVEAWTVVFTKNQINAGERVLLVADASFEAISLIVACSKAQLVFTVLSPETPAGRIQTIVDELAPTLIVRAPTSVSPAPSGGSTIQLEFSSSFSVQKLNDKRHSSSEGFNSSSPAYVVFTSGSTGKPKGIVMSHHGCVSFWQGLIEHAQLAKSARYASMSPLQFDFCLLDIGLCLGSGATLILPNRASLKKPSLMVKELAQKEITHFSGVPTLWKMFLATARKELVQLTHLQQISFAGEHFPKETMCEIADLIVGVEFYNIYGQSESIACTFKRLTECDFRDNRPHLPVGKAHCDMSLFLLDEHEQRVKTPGEIGELYIAGSTLFSGYWKDLTLTDAVLIQNPLHNQFSERVFKTNDLCYFDEGGDLYFIGRKDNQVQINGNRVEIEELETLIAQLPVVNNVCVFYEGQMLQAAITTASSDCDTQRLQAEIAAYLSQRLPSYMLINTYHFVANIPQSTNGKNDRKKVALSVKEAA